MLKAIKQYSSQYHKQNGEHVKGLLNRKPPDTLDILPKGVGHLQERLIGENEVIRDLCKAVRYAEDTPPLVAVLLAAPALSSFVNPCRQYLDMEQRIKSWRQVCFIAFMAVFFLIILSMISMSRGTKLGGSAVVDVH